MKWPNDIFYRNRKIGGILCESVKKENSRAVIIGVGINVNSIMFHKDINGKVDSLKGITGKDYDVEVILYAVMKHLKELLNSYRYPIPKRIMRHWYEATDSIGKKISYESGGTERRGILIAVERDLALVIRDTASGEVINYKGEIIFNDK